MAETISTPPLFTEIVDKNRRITSRWYEWLIDAVVARVNQGAQLLATVSLANQTAAVTVTSFAVGTLSAGLYRLTWYLRIMTPDGVSSSVTVSLGYTDGAVPITLSGVPVTGDTTTTVQSLSTLIHVDQAAPITYRTTYASNTPNKMAYRLDLIVEQIV